MTYPPPGGENPQQYQLQPEPQQPADPYAQGYGSTPPPAANPYQPQQGYGPPPGMPPQQYTQPEYAQPGYPPQGYSQPGMPPQVGVQPGYPTAPGTVLPPPIPQPKQGATLGVILAVVVGLVVVLGLAAVLLIPSLSEDDDTQATDDASTSEQTDPSASADTSSEPAEEETTGGDTSGGGFETWGTPISSEGDYAYDPSTPEGAALAYQVAQNDGDDDELQSLVSADATDDMLWDLDYEVEDTSTPYSYPYWALSRTLDDGTVQAWAGWTYTDEAPTSNDDTVGGYTYTVVEEDGQWKLYDLVYGIAS